MWQGRRTGAYVATSRNLSTILWRIIGPTPLPRLPISERRCMAATFIVCKGILEKAIR